MARRPTLAAFLAGTAIVLAACGSSGGTTAPASAAAPSTVATSPAVSPSAPAASEPVASEAPASAAAGTCVASDSAGGTPAEISGFAFPSGVTVAAGDAVTWTNADGVPHTVTFADGTCDSGTITAGASVTVVYTTPGTYPFTCRIHPNMQGSLEVSG